MSTLSEGGEQQISASNYRLDALAFAVSGLRDGLGPLLGVFLIQKTHLDPIQISAVLAAAGVTNLFLQIPTGVLYDRGLSPYLLIGSGGLCLGASCFLVSLVPPFAVAVSSQVLVGVGGCLLSVGLPALSVRCSDPNFLGRRLARNEIFSKIGNFCTIGLMGFVSQKFNLNYMFYVIYAASSFLSILCMEGFARDTRAGSSIAQRGTAEAEPGGLLTVKASTMTLITRSLLPILIVGFVYQFANASMFMIFEQQWVRQQVNGGVGYISSSLLLTQVTIVVASLFLNRSKRVLSCGLGLQVGMVLVAVRGALLLCGANVVSLFVAQFLDGIIATFLIIVPISSIARFAGSSFNRMSAAFGMVIVAAASLSTICSGFLIAQVGFLYAYSSLISVALIGIVVVTLFRRKRLLD